MKISLSKPAAKKRTARPPKAKTLLAVPRRSPPPAPCSARETAAALAKPLPGFDVERVKAAHAARDL